MYCSFTETSELCITFLILFIRDKLIVKLGWLDFPSWWPKAKSTSFSLSSMFYKWVLPYTGIIMQSGPPVGRDFVFRIIIIKRFDVILSQSYQIRYWFRNLQIWSSRRRFNSFLCNYFFNWIITYLRYTLKIKID